jgi:hypothetical protein
MDFFQLPFQFELSKLLNDLEICKKQDWSVHFNQNDFTGHWSIFSLRSISGKELDILSTPNSSYQNTPTLKECKYFSEILDIFKCEKEAVRLMSLSPKSYIKEHTDIASGYEDGFFRIHVPIQTNEQVIFRVNGKTIPMRAGQCWYANFNLPHYVSNEGENDRIHLVIDCLRNEWSDDLFLKLGYDFENENTKKYDRETKLLMIEQLSLLDSEAATNLIAQLKMEIESNQI